MTHTGTVVFNSEFQPLVAVAFEGDTNGGAELVAVLKVEGSDGTVLVGEPVSDYVSNHECYRKSTAYPEGELYGGLFTYWVPAHYLSKWSEPVYGPVASHSHVTPTVKPFSDGE